MVGRFHDPGLTNQSTISPWPVIGLGKDTCDFYRSSCPWVAKVIDADATVENEANAEENRAKNVQEKQNLSFTVQEP